MILTQVLDENILHLSKLTHHTLCKNIIRKCMIMITYDILFCNRGDHGL